MASNASLASPLEPWPKDEQEEWVRRFFARECPDLNNITVEKVSGGFSNMSFKVVSQDGQAFFFQRSQYPRHRVWAYANCACELGLAPKVLLQRFDDCTHQSVEIAELANGGPLMSILAYVGCKDAQGHNLPNKPDKGMICKCARLLARLHNMETSWHAAFANEHSAEKAGIPKKRESEMNHNIFDPPGGFLVERVLRTGAIMSLDDGCAAQINCDKSFIANEIRHVFDHPILPVSGPLSRIVSAHGDFHCGNIVTHCGEPLATDFEFCFVGPAGFDLALFYMTYIRGTSHTHDYELVAAYAEAYLDETGADMSVDNFIFDLLAWHYFVNFMGAGLTQLLARGASSEAVAYSAHVLDKAYLDAYCKMMAAARLDDRMRAKIAQTGEVVGAEL